MYPPIKPFNTFYMKTDDNLHSIYIEECGNKNGIPKDPNPPKVTSGIRLGTPAGTTRGFKEKEIIQVSNRISDIINDFSNEELQKNIKEEVHNLTSNFPVYNV